MSGILNGLLWLMVWVGAIVGSFGVALVLFIPYLFLVFVGTQKRADKANENLNTILMSNEDLSVKAVQKRIFSLWSRRSIVAITSSRLIVLNRGLLGGFKMKDIQWKDLEDATLKQNILSGLCGSNVDFAHLNDGVGLMGVKGLPNQGATEIYSKAQAEEQAWEEKRRVREIEEVRAASGAMTIHTGQQTTGSESPAPRAADDMLKQIEDAKKLLDQGIINDVEFQEMKSKIIS